MEKQIALWALAAVGGVSGLVGTALHWLMPDIPKVVNRALNELESKPQIKAILIANRKQIEAMFDAVDAAAKANLDSQSGPIQHE